MTAPFQLTALGEHDRASFACGEPALDRYFQTQVTQDVRRRVAACFVAVEVDTQRVAGFYTIAATSLPLASLPPNLGKKLPRYPTLPAVRIGRLAVDERFKGRGLGGALLADAARRSMQSPPAVYALVVDAKHEGAAAFYQRHGFMPFVDQPLALFIPMATAERALLGS